MKLFKITNKQQGLTLLIALVLVFVLLFYLVSFEVRATQMAVVTSFGKPTRSIQEPGLYWKWPYPFQDYFLFDARIQMFAGRLEQTYTADSKNVIIETYVGWKVYDPIKFLSRAGTIKNAQKNLEAMLRHYSNSVISKHPFNHFVSQNPEEIQITQIEQQIQQLLNTGELSKDQSSSTNAGVKESLGIQVELLGIRRIEIPKETTKAVMDRMKEERNRVIQSYRAQGEGKAKEIRAQADAKREEMLIEAQAQAKRIRGEADAAAAKYYKTFAQDRELALWLRKLDSLQKLLSQNNRITIVLDTRTSPFDLLGKPLELLGTSSNTALPHTTPPPSKDTVPSENTNNPIKPTPSENVKPSPESTPTNDTNTQNKTNGTPSNGTNTQNQSIPSAAPTPSTPTNPSTPNGVENPSTPTPLPETTITPTTGEAEKGN